ncbi:MAG TPA: molybdopterin cofactor-binding domain-containing protein [Steroidobacteraceae bacterium]
MNARITRREFVASVGGFAVAIQLRLPAALAAGVERSPAAATFVTAYLEIGQDGTVTLHSPTTEMGQGTHTGHAVIVADELGVDLERVRVVTAEPTDPFRRNGQMGSGGSWGVRHWYAPLRKAAAQAREMLLATAAARWNVPASELTLAQGEVLHAGSQQRIGIGALAAAAGQLAPPVEPKLRDKSELRYTGRAVPRIDLGPKVRGEPVFSSDFERPGTVYACARLAPVFGAELAGFDRDTALAVPGVLDVVAIPGGAAIVAAHTWAALRGAEALHIRFKPTPHDTLDSATISRQMHAGLDDDAHAIKAREDGDLAAVFAAAKKVVSADYEAPYLAHMPMEPWNCNVEIGADGVVHIWAPVQTQDRNLNAAAAAAGVPPEKVRLHTTYLGGGFGRRLGSDGIAAAVITARAAKRPVKFLWRREDEAGQGWYRPAQVARMRAALDDSGRVIGLSIRTAGPALSASFSPQGLTAGQVDGSSVQTLRDSLYKAAVFHVDWVRVDQPVPMAPWRSVGATQNGFFMECFVDEVAHAAVKDPYQLRRELLAHDARALNVIDTAARAAGWGQALPAGRARGMAFVASYGSLCAEVAEVSVRDGRPFVHRVVCALDCGSIVLPDGVRSQVEGGIVQGLSTALGEAVEIADGQAQNRNFDRYPILRMSEAPGKIETIIIESGETMGGVGEPPLPPIAPAAANAVYALTGKPVRKLPIGAGVPLIDP